MSHSLITQTLREPARVVHFRPSEWELVIRQARATQLMGQLAVRLDEHRLLASAPEGARRHLDAALRMLERHRRALQWELRSVHRALQPLGVPVVLLKGAAYCIAGLRAGRGRIFNDIDLMVPRESLPEVEKALVRGGWYPTHLDPYDQRYYRQWMHEIPPMQHRSRRTLLDVHHTIVPPTSGVVPDPRELAAASVPVADKNLDGFFVFAPADMVLHSACHLFFGEFEHGTRDLLDLDQLLREFGGRSEFWGELVSRARRMQLQLQLYYALRYSSRLMGTPIPAQAVDDLERDGPVRFVRPIIDWLFQRAFRPNHPTCNDAATRLARWLAYVRSHWLRMPPHLLIPHLFHKAFLSEKS